MVVASLGGVDLGDAAAIDLRADATAAAAVDLRADATAAAAVDLRGAPLGLLRGVCVGVRVLGWVPVGGVRAVCALKVNSCSISFNPISSAMVLTHVMTMARLACRACRVLCCVVFVCTCVLCFICDFRFVVTFVALFLCDLCCCLPLRNQHFMESAFDGIQQTKFIRRRHVHSSLPCFDSFEISVDMLVESILVITC